MDASGLRAKARTDLPHPRFFHRGGYFGIRQSGRSVEVSGLPGKAGSGLLGGLGGGLGIGGVFLHGVYEVQVLDSYDNPTYPDGQCSALYGRAVPLVNVCRKPGQWQTYDIIYHRPLFEGDKVVRKATFTLLQNGVLVQDHVVLQGGTDWRGPHAVSGYELHEDKGSIALQDHGNPVRYRNIWVRELED